MSDKTKKISKEERIRFWQLSKAAHKLKNRSSKHLRFIKQMKPIYRCFSNASLKELSRNGSFEAEMELTRRSKIHDKNQVRKDRYLAKLAAKRAA